MKVIDNTGLSYLIGKIKTMIGLKADKTYVDNKVKTDVPLNAKFTDTIYTHPTNHPASMITGLPTSLPASGGNADTVGGFTVGINVPASAKFTDTVYTHPANHPPSIISQDANNRFVTDIEKATWNGKSNFSGSYNDLSNKPTITVDSALSSLSTNPVQNKVIKASLDNKADLVDGLIPGAQLPSYVDDVIEASNFAALPTTGEAGKIYVTINDNKTWRWSGSSYVEISASIALGETSSTAYRGDRGKSAYDHSRATGNPHGTQATNINITDSGGYYTTDTVESALQQIGAELDGLAAALEALL